MVPPAGMTTAAITPGIAKTVDVLLTLTTVPRICVGMRNTVGFALGTAWSIVNFFLPVTMSSASRRVAGLPMTLYCDGGLASTLTSRGNDAANALNAP